MNRYPAIYEDLLGQERVVIHNDWHTYSMNIRGFNFTGKGPDELRIEGDTNAEESSVFVLKKGFLFGFKLSWVVPIRIISDNKKVKDSEMHITFEKGKPALYLDGFQFLKLKVKINGQFFVSKGDSTSFEDELKSIERKLDYKYQFITCYNCRLSAYSPFERESIFGTLYCFKDIKGKFLKISSSAEFYELYDENSGFVQSIYSCNEFLLRRNNNNSESFGFQQTKIEEAAFEIRRSDFPRNPW